MTQTVLHLSFYGLEINQPAEWTAFIIVIVIITLALWRTPGAKGFWENHRIVGGKIFLTLIIHK